MNDIISLMFAWWKSYIGLRVLWYSPSRDTKQEIQQIEFCVGGSDYCLHSTAFSILGIMSLSVMSSVI